MYALTHTHTDTYRGTHFLRFPAEDEGLRVSRPGGEEEVKAEMGAFGALGGATELCVGLIPLEHKHKQLL